MSGKAPPDEHQTGLWTQSPATAGYPNLQYSMPTSTIGLTTENHSNLFALAGPRDDPGWPPPSHSARSMSLVQPENLPPQYANNVHESIPNLKRRKTTPSEVMTPSAQDAMLYSSSMMQEPQSAPLGGPYGHGQPMQFPHYPPSSWGPYPPPAHQQPMGPPGWYPPRSPVSTQLPQVKEDESTQFHHHSSPQAMYESIPGSAA
ncbi:MAG: hypothetical protein Q9227_006424 [Pyrenula ochraceoflavens]